MSRIITFTFLLLCFQLAAQAPKTWTSGDIYEGIQKLNVLGSALYVAAHPDDENTSMIAYMSNELKVNTAYLSLTRGDGGQNLIGTEIRELLGVIRTQELLAARRIDGGKQLFSRANDFGFSKHPDETLKIWNEKEVLGDAVWAIRNWQPDIIINRFDHNSAGRTHGHHTASAIISYEAFDLAGKKSSYPEQLKHVDTWQPKRLFFNTSWWFYGSREKFEKADKSDMVSVDVGVYYPIKGRSNSEIAAESRSQHQCQGMGRLGARGESMEYLQLLKGDMPADPHDLFAGIDITWNRVKGGAPIGKILATVEKNFKYDNPAASLPALVKAYKLIKALPDGYWKRVKQGEIEGIMEACMGLFAEALTNDYSATAGETIDLNIEVVNRSAAKVVLQSYSIQSVHKDSTLNTDLGNNKTWNIKDKITLPSDTEPTNPYWLNQSASLGMYTVENQHLRGLPETPRALTVQFKFLIEGEPFVIDKEVTYKKGDPVKGEVYRPFEITPPVFANIQEKVYVFANNAPKTVSVLVKSGKKNISGNVTLARPDGWKIEPEFVKLELGIKGEEQLVTFQLFPPTTQEEGLISPIVTLSDGTAYTKGATFIEYDHIPVQTIFQNEAAKIVRIDLQKRGDNIGYIMGAGDEIPASLAQIGYKVTELKDADIIAGNLSKYDAIILGIRAYNTVERMKFYQPKLLEYVENGGTMIVQYNTTWRLKYPKEKIAPFQMNISRDRVTVEEAEVRFLAPEHAVLNYPNQITAKDFNGWVQERGLYFADDWDKENFTAILSANDPGETPKDGGLLVGKYGKGYYIYTGYSWFRELPAGVPGAYRLFTNMISLGQEIKP